MQRPAVVQADDRPRETVVDRIQQQRSGHLHVHDEDAAVVEVKKEVLTAAGKAGDPAPDDPQPELRRHRPLDHAVPENFHVRNGATQQVG